MNSEKLQSRNVWYMVNREPHLSWPEIEDALSLEPGTASKMFLRENREYVRESWTVAWGRTWELVKNWWTISSGASRLKR